MSSGDFVEVIYLYEEDHTNKMREWARTKAEEKKQKGETPTYKDFMAMDIIHPAGHKGMDLFLEKYQVKKEEYIFDIGCGVGGDARYLAGIYGCKVHAMDYLQNYVDAANEITQLAGLSDKCEFFQGDITNYQVPPEAFTMAVCIGVFLYIPGTEGFKITYDSLKPGSLFYFEDYILQMPREQLSDFDEQIVRDYKMHGIRDKDSLRRDLEAVGFEVARFEEFGREWSEYAWERSENILKRLNDPNSLNPGEKELHTYGRFVPKLLRQLDHLSPGEIRRRFPLTSAEQNPEELVFSRPQFMTVMRVVARKPN
mmetsp:Transcript_5824/g.8646  ORF Transcript_5824/g.8646 Transcript_5824/m.8646 type:complete len:312 (+) Transcript_5824:15-950(+)